MKKELIITLLILSFTYIYSQKSKNLDSLLTYYKNSEGQIEKKTIGNALINYYSKKSPSKALQYWQEINKLLASPYDSTDINIFLSISSAYIYQKKYDSAKLYLHKAIFLSREQKLTVLEGSSLGSLGFTFYKNGLMDSAIYYNSLAGKILKNTDSKNLIAINLYQKGVFNKKIGNFDIAIEAYLEALDLFKELNNEIIVCQLNANIGNLFINMKEEEKAFTYLNKSLKESIRLKDSSNTAGIYNNMGNAYINLSKDTLALEAYQKAKEINLKIKDEIWLSYNLHNIGLIYSNAGDYQKAIKNILKSISLKQKHNNIKSLAASYSTLGSIYQKRHQLNKSIKYFDTAVFYLKKSGISGSNKEVYYRASKSHFKKHDYQKAYEYLTNAYEIMDSTYAKEKIEAIHNVESKYQTAKKEQKIKDLEYSRELQKSKTNLLMGGLVAAGIIILLILFFFFQKRKKDIVLLKQKEIVYEKEKLLTKVELEKAQIKEAELQKTIIFKSKQLTTHALHMMQKNQLLQELKKDLKDIAKNSSSESKQSLKMLTKNIERGLRSDNEWDVFKKYFEEVNQDFYHRLTKINPDITGSDFKIAALIKLNLNIKESASILNIEPNSIKSARYRLRKKLRLGGNENLSEFVREL